MNRSRKWGAAAIVAGMMMAQGAMAYPIREYEHGFDDRGNQRGWAGTEDTRLEPEPRELPGMGDVSAPRGYVVIEVMSIGGMRTTLRLPAMNALLRWLSH